MAKVTHWVAHDYWFERQFDAYTEPMNRWGGDELKAKGQSEWDEGTGQETYRDRNMRPNPLGRNKRTVWKIPTQPFPEAHFAVYPQKLIETPIKAGCPEFICKKCGVAREKIWEIERTDFQKRNDKEKVRKDLTEGMVAHLESNYKVNHKEIGMTDCKCKAGWKKGIVLDPFMGAGTTAFVARALGRDYVGIELSTDYIKIAKRRLAQKLLF